MHSDNRPESWKMERTSHLSSHLHAVGYDEGAKVLRIRFPTASYEYDSVGKHIYDGLMGATMPMSYFSMFIRDKFPTRKVADHG